MSTQFHKITALVLAFAALAIALGLVGSVLPLQAQDNPPSMRTITVTGSGSAAGVPDVANLQLGVDVVDTDPAVAYNGANEMIEEVRDALLAAGIPASDIQTVNFSLWWNDKYNPQTGTPTGEREYHVQQMLNVTVRQIDNVGAVIDAGVRAGANNIYGLTFNIEDDSALGEDAREGALADARARAEHVAATIGAGLGDIVSVTEGTGYPQMGPGFIGAGLGGGGGEATIQEGLLSVYVQVTVTYELLNR